MPDNNSPENLVFKLISDTKEFVTGIKKALDDGLKMIQDYQKKASASLGKTTINAQTKQAQDEVNRLTIALEKAKKEFLALANSALGWEKASKAAGATSKETAGLYDKLSDSAARQKITIQQAAIAAIENGQAQVKAIQDVLHHNNQQIISEKAVADAINKLSANVNNAAKAQGEYTKKTKESDDANKNLKSSTDGLSKAFKNFGGIALSVLGINGILGAIQKVIDIFSDATTAAIDYAQAQFTLAVNVRAASNATGGASGTYDDWLKRIQSLRKELKIFSETDITKAINQTTVLTRVLGLNAEQQEQVIRVGATLAQMTGVDLAQGVDDVTKALGGSSVVLDKYGLFLRDADKGAAAFELGFTEKIEKGTNSLNSQQLAMATLATILKQVNPLMAELTGYQDTLPGQIKGVEADISDASKNLGTGFDTIILGMKQMYLSFLEFLNQTLDNPIFNRIKELVETSISAGQKRREAGGERTIDPSAVSGVSKGLGSILVGASPLGFDSETGISFYTDFQLQGDKENIEAYRKFVESEIARVRAIIRSSDNSLTREPGGGKPSNYNPLTDPNARFGGAGGGSGDAPLDENFVAAQEKLGQELVDNFNDMVEKQRDALLKRNADLEDLNDDFLQEIDDLNTEEARRIEDNQLENDQKREDAKRDYLRDLAELETNESEKRNEIIEDGNRKTEEIWEDYYARLRELDNQYYFDLRDAVAENDAVAIKRLERKYALERQKIDDGLNGRLNDEQDAIDRRLSEFENETKDRAAELTRRYLYELQTIQIEQARQRNELRTWKAREMEDLAVANDRKADEIEEAYQEELDMIELHYQDRLTEITRKLAEGFDIEKGSLRKLFTLYDEYYGEGGRLWELMDEFYEHQNELAGEFNDSIGNLDDVGGSDRNIQVTTTNNGTQMNVVISGDGTISDSTIERLAEEIAERISDSIETVVVGRGGGSGR